MMFRSKVSVLHAGEPRVQREAQQPAFAAGVHGQIEHDAGHRARGHPLDLPRRLLGHQDVVPSDERHGDRLVEIAHHRRDAEGWIGQGLGLDRGWEREDAADDQRAARDGSHHARHDFAMHVCLLPGERTRRRARLTTRCRRWAFGAFHCNMARATRSSRSVKIESAAKLERRRRSDWAVRYGSRKRFTYTAQSATLCIESCAKLPPCSTKKCFMPENAASGQIRV
jgi:hypothetical protein